MELAPDTNLCSVDNCQQPVAVRLPGNDPSKPDGSGLCVEHCQIRGICWGCGLNLRSNPDHHTERGTMIGLCDDCSQDFAAYMDNSPCCDHGGGDYGN